MAVSIWTWKGGTGISTVAGNWTLTAGSGNATGFPAPGDSVIVPSGLIQDGLSELLGRGDVTVQAGAAINAGGGISLGVTAGTSGTLTVNGTGASVVASTAGITDGDRKSVV